MARRWDEGVGVVTPEAVPLQFAEANVGSRAISFFLDVLLLGIGLTILNIFLGYLIDGTGSGFPEWVAIVVVLLVNFVLFFGYWVGFETLTHGRTPGKMAMGLRVVTVEGSPVRFRHAAIRAALGTVDFSLTMGIGAVMTTMLSKRHQRLGDMVAGTVVLRERSAAPPPRAAMFRIPDGAEAYAASIDASGLSVHEYEAVREFLMRSYDLGPQARTDLARRLAAGIAARLQHSPPANVSPELFLRCVAARYQQRFAAAAPDAAGEGQRRFDTPPPGTATPPDAPAPSASPRTEPESAWQDFAPPS